MRAETNYKWLRTVLALCLLLPAGRCAGELEACSEDYTDWKVLAEFRIAKNGDPIFLPVIFKGKEHLFLLDTGCSHTVFDVSFRHELGDAKRTETTFTRGRPIMLELFTAPEAFLGPVNMKGCEEVLCADLKMPSLIAGTKVSGIIGMNFLKEYAIQIDFDKGILSILELVEKPNANWGKEMVINYHRLGIPQITGNIGGSIKVDFIVDTGDNTTGALERRVFERVLAEKNTKTFEALFATASGIVRNKEARIDRFSIGSFEYEHLIFSQSNVSALGMLFLSRHLVTFDFPNSRIYLKKGEEFEKADETDMSGLHLLRISNTTLIHSVDKESPAEKAGTKAKDVIIKVGNKDVNTYNMWRLRRILMSEDKRKITMAIKHGNDVKEVSFLLEKKM